MLTQEANRKPRLKVLSLFVACGVSVFATTNYATRDRTSSATPSQSELTATRADAAAERAEAAARRAEEAAKRAEAATGKAHARATNDTQRSYSNPRTDSDVSAPPLEDDDLRRVRFTAAKKLVDFNLVDREARAWLTKNGQAPPTILVAMFEVVDEDAFLTAKFVQRIGAPFWYVKFNRNFEVEEWGTRILTEQE